MYEKYFKKFNYNSQFNKKYNKNVKDNGNFNTKLKACCKAHRFPNQL